MVEEVVTSSLIMLAAKIMTRLLYMLGYPSFAPLSGEYQVGAIQTRLPDSISCQIHYPADASARKGKQPFVPYFRPRAMEGMADYSGTTPAMMKVLSLKRHPCLMNAEPLMPQTKFPLVLFSHGLGGSLEMYTQLCQQIASHGYVVVAMEHQEGSGAYAETPLGQPILYARPDDTPYSRQKVLNFRRPFLEQRVEETTQVLDSLLNQNNQNRPEVQKIMKAVDLSKGISFLGHSFGGATLVLAAQKYLREAATNTQMKPFVPKSLSLLDVWAFPIEDQTLDQGVKLPILSVLSEGWVLTNSEVKQVDQLLEACPDASSFFIPRSSHASFSDAVNWLPRFIGAKLYLNGKKEKRYDTIPTAAKACVQHIQSALKGEGTNIATIPDLLHEYDYTHQKAEMDTTDTAASS